jgi:hypothetical protein
LFYGPFEALAETVVVDDDDDKKTISEQFNAIKGRI